MRIESKVFKEWAEGIQAALVSAAIVVGGLWTALTFGMLGEARRARLEVAELEQKLREQAVIVTDIDASQITVPHDTRRFIRAVLNIHNQGVRNTIITLPPLHVLRATQIVIDRHGIPSAGPKSYGIFIDPTDQSLVRRGNLLVRAGGTEHVSVIILAEHPGLYLLTFASDVSPKENAVAKHEDASEGGEYFWWAEKYIVVR